jgi:hypothetical protein
MVGYIEGKMCFAIVILTVLTGCCLFGLSSEEEGGDDLSTGRPGDWIVPWIECVELAGQGGCDEWSKGEKWCTVQGRAKNHAM